MAFWVVGPGTLRAVAFREWAWRGIFIDEALEAYFVDGAGDAGYYEAVAAVGASVLDDVLFAHCGGWWSGCSVKERRCNEREQLRWVW